MQTTRRVQRDRLRTGDGIGEIREPAADVLTRRGNDQ
jgi:hypothetical protein